jgi:hypothetical protein
MTTGEILGVHHIKIPVTDLVRSRAGYERVRDLEPFIEWPADAGVVRGADAPLVAHTLATTEGSLVLHLCRIRHRCSTKDVRAVCVGKRFRRRQLCAGSSGKFENQLSEPGWRASTDRQSSPGALAVTSSSRASNTHHASCAISSSS